MDFLSIVVPCYNEEECVTMFLDEIQKTLVGFDYEVIFINDGSSDSTLEKIRNLQSMPVLLTPQAIWYVSWTLTFSIPQAFCLK